jgi:hypothetical protein
MATEFTAGELAACLFEEYGPEGTGEITGKVNQWLARGDGVAVFQNHDLSHRDAGDIRIASYGSPAAYFGTDGPPVRLPDTAQHINWRYSLIGTYRGEPLPVPAIEEGETT